VEVLDAQAVLSAGPCDYLVPQSCAEQLSAEDALGLVLAVID